MLKQRRALVVLLVTLMLALPVVAAAASVEFNDPILEDAVRIQLKKPTGDIDRAVLKENLKKLDLREKRGVTEPDFSSLKGTITDLTGLEYAAKLETLIPWREGGTTGNSRVVGISISDLSPIRNLEKLELLDITGNTKGFSYRPNSTQMKYLQEIQHRGAVVRHDGPVKRISGPDRYETAARVFQNYVDVSGEVDTVFLARGDDFADALAGAPLAAEMNAPILLTYSNKLAEAAEEVLIDYIDDSEINKLTVYVLGGEKAISKKVVDALKEAIDDEFGFEPSVTRIGGADRYETAVKIARKLDWDESEVIFASGENYPDALSVGPYAATESMPILLTRTDSLPDCVEDFIEGLEPGMSAVVAGGPAAVSEDVITSLTKIKSGGTKVFGSDVERVYGDTRYETAVELAKHFGLEAGDEDAIFIATGEDYADALTGAALASLNDTGILLVRKNAVPRKVDRFLDETGQELTILGGEAAVSLNNAVTLYDLIK